MVSFGIVDVVEIKGLPNQGASLAIENKRATLKWTMSHFKGEKINQNVIRKKLEAQ